MMVRTGKKGMNGMNRDEWDPMNDSPYKLFSRFD
jgi:hypothetical protein